VVGVGRSWAQQAVEQAPEFGHGQGDQLVVSGCGSPFSAVAHAYLSATRAGLGAAH
jgi:hypothetical protein